MQTMNSRLQGVVEKDNALRQIIAEYYLSLIALQDPAKSIELLTSHVAVMVEMINEFKTGITQ